MQQAILRVVYEDRRRYVHGIHQTDAFFDATCFDQGLYRVGDIDESPAPWDFKPKMLGERFHTLDKQIESENKAEREGQAQLKRPREVFEAMCQQNPDASLFTAHELKTDKSAKEVVAAIAKSLSSEPRPFELLHNDSPKPDVYEIVARQRFSLGILGGTERVCLLVVGQTKPDETLIFYKVLEYQIKTTVDAGSLFNGQDKKQMIPVSPEKIQMTDMLQNQIREGVQSVSGRIHSAIGQAQ